MKAVLALVIIYVGTFLVAIQGSSQSSVRAAAPDSVGAQDTASPKTPKAIDSIKEADIRSLMELIGVRDQVQDAVNSGSQQFREKLLATVPNNDQGQAFVNTWAIAYQKNYNVDQVLDQLVSIYDQHYTEDEIKGLLQFYGSPLGQKVAAEMPKIAHEVQVASREVSAKAAREALQAAKAQSPEVGRGARLGNGQRRMPLGDQAQNQTQAQTDPQQP